MALWWERDPGGLRKKQREKEKDAQAYLTSLLRLLIGSANLVLPMKFSFLSPNSQAWPPAMSLGSTTPHPVAQAPVPGDSLWLTHEQLLFIVSVFSVFWIFCLVSSRNNPGARLLSLTWALNSSPRSYPCLMQKPEWCFRNRNQVASCLCSKSNGVHHPSN